MDCCLLMLPSQPPYKLPVWVRNENDHDVTLPASYIIAELNMPQQVIENSSTDSPNGMRLNDPTVQQNQDSTNLTFDFGD